MITLTDLDNYKFSYKNDSDYKYILIVCAEFKNKQYWCRIALPYIEVKLAEFDIINTTKKHLDYKLMKDINESDIL